ncbi:MAG: hypothetical protein U0R18_19785 [Mycobacterium sp.]
MAASIRPALTAGVAALCAGALTFTATAAPQAASVLTHPERIVSTQVDLRAGTELVMPPKLVAAVSALTEEQVLTVANALNPTPNTPVDGVADAIDNLYNTVEPWVRYGFEVAAAVVAWIPWVGIFSNQIMVVYNFVESLINSGVFNTTDWMRGDGSALKNVADWVVDAGLALVWLGIDEVGAWVPLPPVPIPIPRPPWADLPEGGLGNIVAGASQLLADVSNGIWNIWEPIKGGIGTGVDAVGNALNAISFIPFVPVINFQIQEGWKLIAGEGDALTGFAHDMINAGNQWVFDTVNVGILNATVNAAVTTWNSIGGRIGQAVQALLDWGAAQLENLFGIGYTKPNMLTADAAVEKKSVVASALSVDTPAAEPEVTGDATEKKPTASSDKTETPEPTAEPTKTPVEQTSEPTTEPSSTPVAAEPESTPDETDSRTATADEDKTDAGDSDAPSADEPTEKPDTEKSDTEKSDPEPDAKPDPKPDTQAPAASHTDTGDSAGSAAA